MIYSQLNKPASLGAAALAMGLFAGTVQAEQVVMSGGWVASFSPAIMVTANSSTTVFELQGSHKLTGTSQGEVYVLTTCVGMETATKTADGKTATSGGGRCELKDTSGDKLLAKMETEFDGFTLKIQGGTGKWASAQGAIVSKETFTFESDRQLKGFSNAAGNLSIR